VTWSVRGRGYWFVPFVFGLATLGPADFYQDQNPCPAGQSVCTLSPSRFTTTLLHAGLTPALSAPRDAAGIYWLIVIPAAFALVVGFFVIRRTPRPVGRLASAAGAGPILLAALVMLGYVEPGGGNLLPGDFTARGLVGVLILSLTMLVMAAVERNKTLALLAVGAVGVALLANLYDIENVTGHRNSATAPNVVVPVLYFLFAALALGLPDLLSWAWRALRGGEAPRPAA
jgi:hypothetical protein